MLDPAAQADIAKRAVEVFGRLGIEVVLVGSTSIVATRLFEKASKDVDILAPARIPASRWEKLLASAAAEMGAGVEERGWGVKSLVKRGPKREEVWAVDVLIPEVGPIPEPAAKVVRAHAVMTSLGLAAIPEHVVAMKSVAWGDCLGQGDEEGARVYEADLVDLGDAVGDKLDWSLVAELVDRFPEARSDQARYILRRSLGAELRSGTGRDVA